MGLFGIFVFWILLSALVGAYASKKGRSGSGYFGLAIFLSPLIAFLVVLAGKADRDAIAEKSGLKKCPQCAEYVQAEALVCRFCGKKFPSEVAGIVLEE